MKEVQLVAKTFHQDGDNYLHDEEDIGDTDNHQAVSDYVNDDGQRGSGGIDNLEDDTHYDDVADQEDGDYNHRQLQEQPDGETSEVLETHVVDTPDWA